MSADLERVIRLVFQGDNRTASAFRAIGSDMKNMGKAVEDATQPLANMHDRVLKLQAGLGALAVGGLAVAVKAAGEFDTQFRELTTLIDDTGENVDKFRIDILNYANSSTQSLDDITKSLYTALSAGVDYGDALQYVAQAEQLAVAGRAGMYESTKLLESVMNAYGAATDEAGHYSDVLFQTVRQGLTTIPELAQSLSQVTSLAAAANVPIETVAAAVATLTAQGVPTAEAMTALRGAIQAIIKPSGEAAREAERLGVGFDVQALEAKGLEGVLLDVWEATEGNTEEVARLFGNVRGLTGVLAMFGQDGGDAFLEKQEAMRDSAGVTAAAYEKMVDDVGLINQKLLNTIRGVFIRVGDEVLGGYSDVVDSLSDIFIALQESVAAGDFDDIFAVINDIAKDLVGLFNDLARELPAALADVDFSSFAEGVDRMVRSISQLFQRLFGDVDIRTAEGLTSVIQQMVNVFETLNNITEGIIKAWGPWFDLLSKAVEKSTNLNESQEQAIGTFLGVGKAVNMLAGGLGSMGSIMTSVDLLIKAFLAGQALKWIVVFGKMVGAASALTLAAGILAAGLGVLAGTLLRDLFPAIDKVTQKWFGFLDSLDPSKLVAISPALAGVIGLFQKLTSGTRDAIDGVEKLDRTFHKIPWEKDILIGLKIAEDAGSKDDLDEIRRWLDDPSLLEVDVTVDIDEDKYQETKSKLEEEPVEVPMELQVADIEAQSREAVAQIQTTSEIVQESLRWKAELDIAEVQANAQVLEAVFDSISSTMESTGETMLGLFGMLSDFADTDRSAYHEIREQIAEESRMREEAHNKNMMLIDAQLEMMRKRAQAMDRGDAMISIDGQGLQPHLEAFMWEILAAIQVRVNEEGMDMLLGVS